MARLIGMMVLGFCLFPLIAYGGAGGVVHDATGDWISGDIFTSGNPYTDIIKAQFSINKTFMTVTLTLADIVPSTPSTERVYYSIEVDSDRNPTTGLTGYPYLNGMGVEYEVDLHYHRPSNSWYLSVFNWTQAPTFTHKYSAGSFWISRNRAKMTFPLSEIDSPTDFNFVFCTCEYNPSPYMYSFDNAPNTGLITVGK